MPSGRASGEVYTFSPLLDPSFPTASGPELKVEKGLETNLKVALKIRGDRSKANRRRNRLEKKTKRVNTLRSPIMKDISLYLEVLQLMST
jgi:hypothetical protein